MSEIVEPVQAMLVDDHVAVALGLQVHEAGEGRSVVSMEVRQDMVNGLGVCHGGMLFTLADASMAYTSNAYGPATFATNAEIDFLRPARLGDTVTAVCTEVAKPGKAAVHDVTLTIQDGTVVAVFRGRTLQTR
ncbi:MAG: hydroxyphenylacetyl-CoA thioesterase PaaI [Ilumatobacteraceae bacterium]